MSDAPCASTGAWRRVDDGPAVQYWALNPACPGVLGRLDLHDLWWAIANGVPAAVGQANPLALVQRLVGHAIDAEVLGVDPWTARMLLADRYRDDRVFLVGDAAHLNPPWGGHGFNTRIGDAVNIGWKLAAVLAGWGGERLLSSYEAERRPIAALTIQEAVVNMSTLAPDLADPALDATGPVHRHHASPLQRTVGACAPRPGATRHAPSPRWLKRRTSRLTLSASA